MNYDAMMERLRGQIARWIMTDAVDLETSDEAIGPTGAPADSYTLTQAGIRCRIENGRPGRAMAGEQWRGAIEGRAIFVDPIAAGVTDRLTVHVQGKPDRHLYVTGTKDIQDRGKVFIVDWTEYPPAN